MTKRPFGLKKTPNANRADMTKKPTETPLSYEAAWQELQTIVQALQEEIVGIDDLSQKINRANELIRFCREKLRQAESEIGKLGS